MTARPPGSSNTHIYQVITYGRPSSGKTCLLAALAMPRGVHPEGYDAIWVRDESTIPRPAGKPETWDQKDPAVTRFLGRERLPMAIREIESGKLPPATAIDVPFRFLFDLTTPDGCIRRVEMVDYSGELVNADITEGDFAKQLIKHMETSDAILVLAEATGSDEQADRVRRDLHKLREALALVSEKRRRSRSDPFPIGLVYDKWDRYSRMEKFSSAEAQLELTEFLAQKPPPPHVTLRNVLRAVAGDERYFREFVASAFGKAKKVSIQTANGIREQEMPVSVSPLQSYGLEDPFIEVCRAADELELFRLNREVSRLSPWKLWQLPGRLGMKVAAEAVLFSKRFPRHMPQHKSALELAALAGKRMLQQISCAAGAVAILLMMAIQGSFVAYDEAMFAFHGSAITKPFNPNDFEDSLATLPKWKRAEEYLGAFQTRTWYRFASHWRHSPILAANQRLEVLERIGPASDMIGKYDKIVAEITGIGTRAENANSASSLATLRSELTAVKIPPGFPSLELHRTKTLETVASRQEVTLIAEDFEILRSEINKLLENGNLSEVADRLAKDRSKYPKQIDELQASIRQGAPDMIAKKVMLLCDSLNNWADATNYVTRLGANEAFLELMGNGFRGRLARAEDWISKHRNLGHYREWYNEQDNGEKQMAASEAGFSDAVSKYRQSVKSEKDPRQWVVNIDKVYFVETGALTGDTIATVTLTANQSADSVSGIVATYDNANAVGSGTVTISGQSVDSSFDLEADVAPTNWIYYEGRSVDGSESTTMRKLSTDGAVIYCSNSSRSSIICRVHVSVDKNRIPVKYLPPQPESQSELKL
jgi:hypothetical protein